MAMVEYITDEGQEMLAQMLAGKVTIDFTKIQMGDGTLETGQSRKTMTALVNTVEELSVYKTTVSDDNIVSVMAIFDNSTITAGFYFREKGIFASDGTNEILFAYANSGSSAEYINPPTVELVEKQIISNYTSLQDTDTEISITVKSGIYALQEDLDETKEEMITISDYTATITTTWTGTTAPYTQEITVTGITEDDIVEIIPQYSGTLAEKQAQKKAISYIDDVESGADKITLTCFKTMPTTEIEIMARVVK